MPILAYLFQRVPVHKSYYSKFSKGVMRYVQFPDVDVPAAIREHVEAYNTHVRSLFIGYLQDFVLNAPHEASFVSSAFQLPLSKLQFVPGADSGIAAGGVVSSLKAASKRPLLRSPLVAINGSGDSFTTVEQLAAELRTGMFVSPSQVPVFDEGKWVLNRYIQDFYGQKSFKSLEPNGFNMHEANVR